MSEWDRREENEDDADVEFSDWGYRGRHVVVMGITIVFTGTVFNPSFRLE